MATNLLRLIGASKEEIEAYLGDVTSDQFIKDVKAISSSDRTKAAMAAMQGLLSNLDGSVQSLCPNIECVQYMAKLSVSAADELLKQLEP